MSQVSFPMNKNRSLADESNSNLEGFHTPHVDHVMTGFIPGPGSWKMWRITAQWVALLSCEIQSAVTLNFEYRWATP